MTASTRSGVRKSRGQLVVVENFLLGHSEHRQQQRRDHTGPVFACGAMKHRRQTGIIRQAGEDARRTGR